MEYLNIHGRELDASTIIWKMPNGSEGFDTSCDSSSVYQLPLETMGWETQKRIVTQHV